MFGFFELPAKCIHIFGASCSQIQPDIRSGRLSRNTLHGHGHMFSLLKVELNTCKRVQFRTQRLGNFYCVRSDKMLTESFYLVRTCKVLNDKNSDKIIFFGSYMIR